MYIFMFFFFIYLSKSLNQSINQTIYPPNELFYLNLSKSICIILSNPIILSNSAELPDSQLLRRYPIPDDACYDDMFSVSRVGPTGPNLPRTKGPTDTPRGCCRDRCPWPNCLFFRRPSGRVPHFGRRGEVLGEISNDPARCLSKWSMAKLETKGFMFFWQIFPQ